MKATYFFLIIFLMGLFLPGRAQDFWQQTNGPPGGDVRALIVNDNDDIFAGTWGAGIFRSTDNGDSWAQVNDGITNKHINAFAIHPNGMIFAGAYNAGGVFFSTDNGNSWNHTLAGISILSLTIDPGGDIFSGTNGFVNNGIPLYRSTDNGQTWIPLTNGLPSTMVVLTIAAYSEEEFYLGSNDGIYHSLDNGNSWMQVGLDNFWVEDMLLCSNGEIFAGSSDGVYRSSDNGSTWVKVLNTDVQTMVVNSAGHLFAGTPGAGIYRSIDGGDSWITVNTGLYNKAVWAIAINSHDHPFAGTLEGGVFRSIDNGDHWIQTNSGLNNSDVFSLAIYSNDTLFAGTRGNGLFFSTDKGENWTQMGFQALTITAIAISPLDYLFVATIGQGMFRSTNQGATWEQINYGLPSGVIANRIPAILIKPDNNYIFLATTNGIYRSIDNGDSWAQVGLAFTTILSLARNSQGDVYAGIEPGLLPVRGIYGTTNNGNSWAYLGLASGIGIYAIGINSQDHIFAGGPGMYRSTDYGNTWVQVNNGLNNPDVVALAINSQSYLFAGTGSGGIYRSINNGDNWEHIISGLPYSWIPSLATDFDGYIFAGTMNGGAFRSVNPITAIDRSEDPALSDFSLQQNYPNPFNPKTTIQFYSPRKAKIVIEVFNILGAKMKTLFEGETIRGAHSLVFDASGLPSGVYFYRLKAPGISLTKKMVLLQ